MKIDATALVEARQIHPLIESLQRRDHKVVGPTVRNGAIVDDCVENVANLPVRQVQAEI